MKVLGISGSMRKDGNTAMLVKVILERCHGAGVTTEFVSLAGKKIHPCLGCEKCKEKKWCVIENDDWDTIAKKILDCDVLVIGSPTYYFDVCGHLKNFIDRTYSLYHDLMVILNRIYHIVAEAVALTVTFKGNTSIFSNMYSADSASIGAYPDISLIIFAQ